MIETTRRNLLGILAAAWVVGPLFALPARFGFSGRRRDWAGAENSVGRRIEALFRDPGSARAIGSAYLAADPHARSASIELAEQLRELHPHSAAELREHLRARIERDFGADRTAVVDRWILAETEAQICALTVLL